MKLVSLPVLVALLAQFGSVPLLIGAGTFGEAVVWPIMMAAIFGIPSAVIYLVLFGVMRATMPPPWLAVALGLAVPVLVTSAGFRMNGVAIDVIPQNPVLWMGLIGGLAGTITHIYLRTNTSTAA